MNGSQNKLLLEIPITEIRDYQQGILGILGKVELNKCDETLKKDLKAVYKLLGYLLVIGQPEVNQIQPQNP